MWLFPRDSYCMVICKSECPNAFTMAKILLNTGNLSFIFRRLAQLVAAEFAKTPESIKQKEAELQKEKQKLDNLVGYIAQGRQSKAVKQALGEVRTDC